MRRVSGEIPGKFEELGHSNVLFALAIKQDFWKKKKSVMKLVSHQDQHDHNLYSFI